MSQVVGRYVLLGQARPVRSEVETWWARPIAGGAPVLLTQPATSSAAVTAEFQRRALAWSMLDDATLPKLIELKADESFAIYRGFAGASLASLIAERRGSRVLSLGHAIELAQLIATAVGVAHDQADGQGRTRAAMKMIDPESIAVSPRGKVFLFGFQFDPGSTAGDVFAYSSPEVVTAGVPDHRSDIFSIGCVLYALLTGVSPFEPERGRAADAIERLSRGQFAMAGAHVPGISIGLEGIIAKCLKVRPEDRYSTATEVANALEQERPPRGAEEPSLAGAVEKSQSWREQAYELDRIGVIEGEAGRPTGQAMIPVQSSAPGMLYYVDRALVTKKEYSRFVKTTDRIPPKDWPSGQVPATEAHEPVTNVSYGDALDYAEWVGKRLPTEIEWEAASCAAGVEQIGRVWEWTSTWWDDAQSKVVRGGKWRDPDSPPPSTKNRSYQTGRAPDVGFRCAIDMPRIPPPSVLREVAGGDAQTEDIDVGYYVVDYDDDDLEDDCPWDEKT